MVLQACKAGEQVSKWALSQLNKEPSIHTRTRIGMEDSHTTITSYADTGASFFAVFDGHGGWYSI